MKYQPHGPACDPPASRWPDVAVLCLEVRVSGCGLDFLEYLSHHLHRKSYGFLIGSCLT